MVNLYDEFGGGITSTVFGSPAEATTNFHMINGKGNCTVVGIRDLGGYGDFYRCYIYAIDEGKTGLTIQGEDIAYNTFGSDSRTYHVGTVDVANNYVTTLEHGGNLLDLANAHKDIYFGGVTQTAVSLMSYLNEMYGPHAGYYAECVVGGQCWMNWPERAINGTNKEIVYRLDQAPNFLLWNPDPAIQWVGDTYAIIPTAETTDDILADLVFGKIKPPTKLHFDVYVNGTKAPNVSVRWRCETKPDDFSLQTVNPIVWGYPTPITVGLFTPIVENEDDINVPNDSEWYVQKHAYTWGGEYDAPYLVEFENITSLSGYNTLSMVTVYGIDMVANSMHYYLRFNYQFNDNNVGVMTWGELFDVEVPYKDIQDTSDIIVTEIQNSSNNPQFTTEVHVHLSAPPDDVPEDDDSYPDGSNYSGTGSGVYDPDGTIPDFSTSETHGFNGYGHLTTTYIMDGTILDNIASKLWTQNYYDVMKIQSNPIENIVGCKWFPFSDTGSAKRVRIGDVDFGIDAQQVSTLRTDVIGTGYYRAKDPTHPTFLDCSPYTTIKLHLPFVGTVQLDATEMLNRSISVKYVTDLVTGDCIAYVYLDDHIPYMNVAGHIGVDIPLTSTNRVQTEISGASTTLSAVVGAGAHLTAGDVGGAVGTAGGGILNAAGMDYTSQRSSVHSPACNSQENHAVYLEIFRPAFNVSDGFKSRHGYPTHKYMSFNTLGGGFVKCDSRIKIDFAMTSEENEILESLLTSGVYI